MATVTVLASAPVTGISEANALNNAGTVVGQDDTVFPFLWQPAQPNGTTGTLTRLPVLPTGPMAGEATAMSINNNGVVAGFSAGLDAQGNAVTRAVVWIGGTVQDLGTLIPDLTNPGSFLGSSKAIDINDAGQVVGRSDTIFGSEHAFLFDPAVGVMRDLGALIPISMVPATPDPSRATSINNLGDIVGVSAALDKNGNVVERAFLLPAGAVFMIDLGTLIADPNNPGGFLETSGAFGINDHGKIIGTSDAGIGPSGSMLTGAVEFANGAAPTALLPMQSDGYDIGPGDHVVGSFNLPSEGFVSHATTGMVMLTGLAATSGMTIVGGTGVNSSGQLTALADVGGSPVGVLITP